MQYQTKLKDVRWQKKSAEIKQRDKWTCVFCGAKDKFLNVHHINYYREPWEAPNDALITLCEDCHDLEHKSSQYPLSVAQFTKKYGLVYLEFVLILNQFGRLVRFGWKPREVIYFIKDLLMQMEKHKPFNDGRESFSQKRKKPIFNEP